MAHVTLLKRYEWMVFFFFQFMKMTEGRDSPCDNSEQTNLVHYMSDPSSDSCSHSELSDMESPSRLSPLEDEVNQESSSPFVQLKMKRMLEEAYFVPIPHDPSLSRMNSCPTAISNNGPSAFTKVKSSRDEINKTNTKHFNLIKLNQIKSVFAKSGSYSNTGSAGTSPVALGHTFALKKSFKKEAFHEKEQFFKNGIDPLGSSSRNSSPLQAKEELVDHESPVNSKSYKVSLLIKFFPYCLRHPRILWYV